MGHQPDVVPTVAVGDNDAPAQGPLRARGRLRALSLRSRLLLLVFASVMPMVCMGVVREYLDFRADRELVYDKLLTIARGMAVSVERDLQIRVSALETLAMTPALQTDDLAGFDEQANIFLQHLPPGTVLGLAGPDLARIRTYGLPPDVVAARPKRDISPGGLQVFETGRPIVTDLHKGNATGRYGFNVEVPVFRQGRVVYALYMRLRPSVMEDLIVRQHLLPQTVMTVVDTAGLVVARVTNSERFVGSKVVPALWESIQSRNEWITRAPTLEGIPAVVAYTHLAPFNWSVVVGAPENVIFASLRAAIVNVTVVGFGVLAAGLVAATFAARGIFRPIDHLRRLAENSDRTNLIGSAATGLPETDAVARALVAAALERWDGAQKLAEREQLFRALFERSATGILLVDPVTTNIIDGNDVAASFLGYEINEIKGRTVLDFALQTPPERVREICSLVEGGKSIHYETRVQGRNGPRDLVIAAAPVQVSGNTLVLINQIDITDLRRAEAGLRVNEERLELAKEGANLGIWDWDIAAGTLTWSEHQWRLHGMEPGPGGPTPEAWQQAVHPADLKRTQDELVAALKAPARPYASEYSVVLPDGSLRRLIGRGQTIRGCNGRAVRMVGINMDVTARYEAEMARDRLIWMLETERSRLAEIIEALPIGVGIVDTAGRIVLGNAMMERLNGSVIPTLAETQRGEWISLDAGGNPIAPEDFPIRRALRLGETTLPGAEFLYREPDGKETWYRIVSQPLRWDNGQVQEALGIFQDINAEKRLLEIQQQINAKLEQRVLEEMTAREAAQQRAAHAERMHALGQIAGGIAHDFNNVLQAVSGGAALIERRPDDSERVLRNARIVLDAARRGAAITSRLLAFARRGDLRAENIDAAALLSDMAEVLTHTLGGSVVCDVDVPPNLPYLFADRGQLETVLVNLATNARDAMHAGGKLTMSADTEIVSAGLPHAGGLLPGSYVRIMVRDTGVGMDRSVLARVTEPFFTTKEPGKGTGLGLAMAKGFVEQSGGSLSIDSSVGSGTCITLWLPRAAPDAELTPDYAARGMTHTNDGKACVLLVDDDAIVREVLSASLDDSGYRVLSADSGAVALSRLQGQERVDILISDLTMPAMDGLALIRAAQELRPHLPAVLLTGYSGDGATLAVGGTLSGTFSLLRKPVSGTQLVERIHSLLETRKQPSHT